MKVISSGNSRATARSKLRPLIAAGLLVPLALGAVQFAPKTARASSAGPTSVVATVTEGSVDRTYGFLASDYVQMALNGNGILYGSFTANRDIAEPSGFIRTSDTASFGLMALRERSQQWSDVGDNLGDVVAGDFFAVGTLSDAWALRVGNSSATNSFQSGPVQGSLGSLTTPPAGDTLGWSSTGSYEGISVQKTHVLPVSNQRVDINVRLTNTTSAPISDVFYARMMAPFETLGDNIQPTRKITSQRSESGYSQAVADFPRGTHFSLFSTDARSRVGLRSASATFDPQLLFTPDGGFVTEVDAESGAIGSIFIGFDVGTLGPNQRADLTYSITLSSLEAAVQVASIGVPPTPSVSVGNGTATLDWDPIPTLDPVTKYTLFAISLESGVVSQDVDPPVRPATFSGLNNGEDYRFGYRIRSSRGGDESTTELSGLSPFFRVGAPTRPTIESVEEAGGALTVSFGDPEEYGGFAFLRYEYSTDNGVSWREALVVGNDIEITTRSSDNEPLENGVDYQIALRTVNDGSVASFPSDSVSAQPGTVPSIPLIEDITVTESGLEVSFVVDDNGGSALTNFRYSTDGGDSFSDFAPAQIQSPLSITKDSSSGADLAGSTSYDIVIKARNGRGLSGSSPVVVATTLETFVPTPPNDDSTPSDSTSQDTGSDDSGPSSAANSVKGPDKASPPAGVRKPPIQRGSDAPSAAADVEEPLPSREPARQGLQTNASGGPMPPNGTLDSLGAQLLGPTRATLTFGGSALELRVLGNGQLVASPEGSGFSAQLSPGAEQQFRGGGLLPGASVQVRLALGGEGFLNLAETVSSSDGDFELGFVVGDRTLDGPIPIGAFSLVIESLDQSGDPVALEIPVEVKQGEPRPESWLTSDVSPALASGQFVATAGGQIVDVQVERSPSSGVIRFIGESWDLLVGFASAPNESPGDDDSERIVVAPGTVLTLNGDGLLPGTRVDVWVFSEPQLIGSAVVDDFGRYVFEAEVPGNLFDTSSASHTLQVQSVGLDGYVQSVNLGFDAQHPSVLVTDSGSSTFAMWAFAWFVIIVVLVVALAVGSKLRRRALSRM